MKESNKIDWSQAPEGATHYRPECDEYNESWFRDITNESYEIYLIKSGRGWETVYYSLDGKEFAIERPKSQSVFTKEMQGAGELPPVGSKAICEYGNDEELLIVAHDLLNEDGAFALVCDSTGYWGAEARRWKPIDNRTDKEKAIEHLTNYFCDGELTPTEHLYEELFRQIKAGEVPFIKWVGKE